MVRECYFLAKKIIESIEQGTCDNTTQVERKRYQRNLNRGFDLIFVLEFKDCYQIEGEKCRTDIAIKSYAHVHQSISIELQFFEPLPRNV